MAITSRSDSKELTETYGTNLSNSGSTNLKRVDISRDITTTSGSIDYQGEDQSQKVIGGAGVSTGGGGGEVNPPNWGWTAPSGSRIQVFDGGGNERIDIVHHSGAGMTIEPDGGVFVSTKSSRGAGIGAPMGDVYITAGGDVVIKGSAQISVSTSGDLTLDVGGTLNIKCSDFKLVTNSYNESIDGSRVSSITNDNSAVIGGHDRKTVAGDSREQVSHNKIYDIGDNSTTRVGGNQSLDIIGNSTSAIKGNQTASVAGNNSIAINGSNKISSKGDCDLFTGGAMKQKASGNFNVKGGSNTNIQSGSNLNLRGGSNTNIQGSSDVNVKGGSNTNIQSGGSTNVKAGGSIKLDGSAVNAIPGVDKAGWADRADRANTSADKGPEAGSPPDSPSGANSAASAGSADDASQGSVADAKDAQVMESNDIIDSMTSARKYPQYPGNGARESSNATALGMISGDEVQGADGVYKEYSGGNQGNANPSQLQQSYATLPDQPINRDQNITAADTSSIPTPSRHDLGTKISKYFTVGQLVNGTTTKFTPPPNQWEEKIKCGISLANNVLDPIKEKFPDIMITSWWRTSSSNHITGRAVDIVVESRSAVKHAEIARYARDNLPCDQVFIEKNDYGHTHVHLRVSESGHKGNPMVLTCGDAKCRTKTSGIDVAWLARYTKVS